MPEEQAKHTPLPWYSEGNFICGDITGGRPGGEVLASCYATVPQLRCRFTDIANAELIVRAVNYHAALLEALKEARREITRLEEFANPCGYETENDVHVQINEAIQLAEGN